MTGSTPQGQSRTHIVKAIYGIVDKATEHIEVTQDVARMVRPNGALVIKKVDGTVFGGLDPAPGKVKSLQVKFTDAKSGVTKTVTVKEGDRLVISGDHKGVKEPYTPSRAHSVQAVEWESVNGTLVANGTRFHLKGINWFGLETEARMPHGLWKVSYKQVLGFLQKEGFNAIRLPFSTAMALDLDKINTTWFVDEEFRNLSCGEVIGKFVDKCGEYGMLVMLDNHRLDEQNIPDLWYDDEYTEADLLKAWDNVLDICKDKWNIFALDLKNEPHGEACWGMGNAKDWNVGAELIANHITENHPEFKGLFFIEGINDTRNMDCDNPCPHAAWWGGSFQGLHKAPITLTPQEHNKRIVFSPHVYGPSVHMQEYFKDPKFPANLPEIWMAQWGFAKELTGHAVVLGEWGGWMDKPGPIDAVWQNAMADFMIKEGFTDQFYWCLNPDSGDTGGLVEEDWTTPIKPKVELLRRVVPEPSKVTQEGQGFTISA